MSNVGYATLSIIPSMRDFHTNLTRDFGAVEGHATASGDRAVKGFGSKFTGGMKSIGLAAGGALASGFAAFKAVDFLGEAITGASDLAEVQSKVNTVFGDFGKDVSVYAKAADAIGLSDKAALDALGTFGNLFDQLGIGAKQSSGMSTSLTDLAADLGSFHNADITDVIDSMTSAFRGEFDSVQKFIPTINAAAVQQKAMAMTGKTLTKDLTDREKVLATQALLVEGAGAAMGDFARTSDGLANKQRILSARMEDLKATIGEKLLPVVTSVTSWLADKLPGAIARVGPIFSQIGTVVKGFFGGLGTEAGEGGGLSKIVASLKQFGEDVLPQIQEAITHFVNAARGAWELFGDDVLRIVGGFIERTMSVIRFFLAVINGDWSAAWQAIKDFVDSTLEVMKGVLGAAWDAIKLAAGAAFDALVGFAKSLPGRIVDGIGALGTLLWGAGTDLIAGLAGGIKDLFMNGTGNLVSFLGEIPGKIVDGIGDLKDTLVAAGRAVIGGLIRGIKEKLGDLKDTLTSIPGKIVSWKGPVDYDRTILVPAGIAIMEGLVHGIATGENLLRDRLRSVSAMVVGEGRVIEARIFKIIDELYGRPTRHAVEFAYNGLYSPHAGMPGYVQAEDGSWVPTSFYLPPAPIEQPAASTGDRAGRPRPTVHVEHAYFQDEVDIDMFGKRFGFAVAAAGGFGG